MVLKQNEKTGVTKRGGSKRRKYTVGVLQVDVDKGGDRGRNAKQQKRQMISMKRKMAVYDVDVRCYKFLMSSEKNRIIPRGRE